MENRLEGDLPGAPKKSTSIRTDTEVTSDADAAAVETDDDRNPIGDNMPTRVDAPRE